MSRLDEFMAQGRLDRTQRRAKERSRLQQNPIGQYRGQENLEVLLEYPNGEIVPKGRQITNGAIVSGETPLILTTESETLVYGMPHRREESQVELPAFTLRWENVAINGPVWERIGASTLITFPDGNQCGGDADPVEQMALLVGFLSVRRPISLAFSGSGNASLFTEQRQALTFQVIASESPLSRVATFQELVTQLGYGSPAELAEYFTTLPTRIEPWLEVAPERTNTRAWFVNGSTEVLPTPNCGMYQETLIATASNEYTGSGGGYLTWRFPQGRYVILISAQSFRVRGPLLETDTYGVGAQWQFNYRAREV